VALDEVLVYSPGFILGTISFAQNGTLFFNYEFNVYKLVNETASSVGDIRPQKDQLEYYGIAVAPNGSLYASVNDGTFGWIYKVVNGKISNETSVFKRYGQIREMAFHPSGELFYTDGESVYSIKDGYLFNKTRFSGGGGEYAPLDISSISFASNGTLFICVSYGHWVEDSPLKVYSVVWKIVGDDLEWVYARYWAWDTNGIDDIAISPRGELYFEDYGAVLEYGYLYRLVSKARFSLQNANFFFYGCPVVTNSTGCGEEFNFTLSNELKINLTSSEGTMGVAVVTVFSHFLEGWWDLDVKVEPNVGLINCTKVKCRDYIIYLVYNNEEQIPFTIKLLRKSPPLGYAWLYVTLTLVVLSIIIAMAIMRLRKKRITMQ
jgi:hypothetical protein